MPQTFWQRNKWWSGPVPRRRCALPLLVAGSLLLPVAIRPEADAPLKKQLPADVRAFRAARNLPAPEQRLAALQAFLKDYPDSSSTGSAREKVLEILLKNFPDRTTEIDETARAVVKHADKGYDRWHTQEYVADVLAETGTSGVDLPLAQALIDDTNKQLTEKRFDKIQVKLYRKYNEVLSAEELQKHYKHVRAEVLLVMAHVALKQGHVQQASDLLNQAEPLEPLNDELNYLRGEIALQDHRPADALVLFERAQLLGTLPDVQRKDMMRLYREAHNGDMAGFEAELDRQYAALYPAGAEGPAHVAPAGGHTALLELYTGSGCGPCVGGDVAVERVLESRPASEVVVLAFDQHIPEPDPLANPSSIERATAFHLGHTPSYLLDGKSLEIYGGDREAAAKLYNKLAPLVDEQASRPSAVQLKLRAAQDDAAPGTLRATAEVQLAPQDQLRSLTAQENLALRDEPAAPGGKAPAKDAAVPSAAKAAPPKEPEPPQPELYFALVEDNVRYSGENGMRFHRMVVRDVKRADSATLKAGESVTAGIAFDPQAIAKANASYLDSYEKGNDRFGVVEFLSKDTSMHTGDLAIAAWVQDAVSHRVLQAAFLPVGTPNASKEQAR